MLRKTRPWVRFISVLSSLLAALLFIGGVAIVAANLLMSDPPSRQFPIELGFAYLAMGLIYIGPALYLHRFASRIKELLAQRRESDLEAALKAQKSFWKLVGIMALVVLCLYVVLMIVLVLFAVSR